VDFKKWQTWLFLLGFFAIGYWIGYAIVSLILWKNFLKKFSSISCFLLE